MQTITSNETVPTNLDAVIHKNIATSNNCAQNAFATIQEHCGLDGEAIVKALTAFPGGVALRAETCGVVVGCLMALGLVFGSERPGDMTGFYDTLKPAQKFCDRFAKAMGGTMCRQIVKSDLRNFKNLVAPASSPQQIRISSAQHRAGVVSKGVRIAVKIIEDN